MGVVSVGKSGAHICNNASEVGKISYLQAYITTEQRQEFPSLNNARHRMDLARS